MIGVPIGSVLTGVIYEIPTWYGYGDRFDDRADGINASLDQWAATESDLAINPPAITERWVMRAPDGTTADVAVETTTIAPHLTVGVVRTEQRRAIRERLRTQTFAATDS